MIKIKQSKTADTRTCDFSKLTKDQLKDSSMQHMADVRRGLTFFLEILCNIASNHDNTKLKCLDEFYEDFKTGFKKTDWWVKHQKEERHHFNNPEYIQDDVNLLDILEQIVDGVMAGMSRSGKYRQEPISNKLLQKAYKNTVKLLLDNVQVE